MGRDRARRQMRLMGLQAIFQAAAEHDPVSRALTEALERYGRPQIFNTDQGSRFTVSSSPPPSKTPASLSPWTAGAGAWTTSSSSVSGVLKYEAVYLHELSDGFQAQRVIVR